MSEYHQPKPIKSLSAFTLLELVAVMAILGILVSVGMSFMFKAGAKTKEDKARADLQVIQVGLEKYRARFGNYPQVPDSGSPEDSGLSAEAYLLNALFGKLGPTHDVISNIPPMLNSSVLSFAKPGLPISELQEDNWIVDPWGTAYSYNSEPKNENDVLLFGYELKSAGPDVNFDTGDDIIAE